MTVFDKQDVFAERMLNDYSKGVIPQAEIFRPYFDWKSGKASHPRFSITEAHQMQEVASDLLEALYSKHQGEPKIIDDYINDDPWQNYRWLGEDAYLVSYLGAIEAELTNISS